MDALDLSQLSPDRITARLYDLRGQERQLLVELLRYLGEVDRRRLYLEMAFPSLFAFATDFLGYSKAAAFRRTTGARLLARFPVVAEHLTDGRLNLTTLVELRDVLEEERLDEILTRAAGRTEEQVKELVATLAPQVPPVDLFRRLPAPAAPATSGSSSGPEQVQAPLAGAQARAPRLEPISEELHVLRLTVSADFARDLEAVRSLLGHKIPDGNLIAVLHECLRVTLAAREKARRGTGRPARQGAAPDPTSRYIPAAVRDAVWRRDQGRCAFIADDGRRCAATDRLELHHVTPFARGGAPTVDGIALRCKPHNLHQARRDFGDDHVERAIARSRGAAADPRQASLF